MNVETIAQVCHEANKALCESQGDYTQVEWSAAADWQKESAIKEVQFALDNPNATPADQHQSWCDAKVADGWVYGDEKNPETKEHPCLVDYDQLPENQRAKDYLFQGIVRALSSVD